ncbi:acyl-CoA dehydrogenase family protein [Aquipuribacter nitratireducens]|uniref:Acyl-CoA dehydrogenase family protein n=1 Tax=Aquipuribacter nitratireducens TaxID=650104 RepID=A0ABW0GJK8_9MICO
MTGRRRPFPAPARVLPDEDAADLLELTREIGEAELAPRAAEAEERAATAHEYPRDTYRLLGKSGLLGLPYPEELGGGGRPYTVYLQVVEELARSWASIAMGVSVHVLACNAVATAGTREQQERWLPDLLGGELLAGYCLSEHESGSDAAAMRTRAERSGEGAEAGYRLHGTKAWITHGGMGDVYTVFARTSPRPESGQGPSGSGISAFLVPGDAPGLSAAAPERKMGFDASRTSQVLLDDVRVGADRLLGAEGDGFTIAKRALDAGRLGIAAVAVGVAQAALEDAVAYAKDRRQFGRAIIDNQGLGWLLADMATAVTASRALYLEAARLLDAGDEPDRVRATASMAKTFCTDSAVRVTTDAVQVLGGAGYVRDHRAERLMREAKLLQIVEGTNQVQRVVVAGALARS